MFCASLNGFEGRFVWHLYVSDGLDNPSRHGTNPRKSLEPACTMILIRTHTPFQFTLELFLPDWAPPCFTSQPHTDISNSLGTS